MKTFKTLVATLLFSTAFTAGCATTSPPRELVDARTAYKRAETAPGVELSPVPLYAAKAALADAEKSFTENPKSHQTRVLAYVADRKSRLSEAESGTAFAGKQETDAKTETAAVQARSLASTKEGLRDTQNQLGNTQDALGRTQGALNLTADQLANEKQAREAAEARTRDALSKLALANSLAIKEETRGTVILLPGNILFVSNKADLLPTAQTKLIAVAEALKEPGSRKITVEGHTDSQGTEASNKELAQRRADSVRNFLISHGVKPETISATGIGQGRPIADNKSPEGRSDNRRVEIVVSNIENR